MQSMSDSLSDTTAAVSAEFSAASADSQSAGSAAGSEQSSSSGYGAAPTSPPAEQTADVDPRTTTGATAGQTVPGPVAYERFREINERMKAAEARASQFDAQQRDLQPLLTWRQQFQNDPIAAFGQLAEELQAHPELGAKFRSQAARWLRSGAPKATESAAMPQADIVDPQTGTKLYSAEQAAALLEWKTQQLLGQVQQQMQPLQDHFQQQQQEKQAQQAWSGALNRASQTLAQWRQMPGFQEHEGKIKELVKQGNDLGLAYAKVVVPTLSQRERQAVTQSLSQKTQTTTVSPGYSPSSAGEAKRYTDTRTAVMDIAKDVFSSLR